MSLSDFLELTPVEYDYFLYVKRINDESKRTFLEDQLRLINSFIFNSNPYLKNHNRIKDPSKLYKLSIESQQLEKSRKENKFRDMEKEEFEQLQSMLSRLNSN